MDQLNQTTLQNIQDYASYSGGQQSQNALVYTQTATYQPPPQYPPFRYPQMSRPKPDKPPVPKVEVLENHKRRITLEEPSGE